VCSGSGFPPIDQVLTLTGSSEIGGWLQTTIIVSVLLTSPSLRTYPSSFVFFGPSSWSIRASNVAVSSLQRSCISGSASTRQGRFGHLRADGNAHPEADLGLSFT
jgi:hypothetical protein